MKDICYVCPISCDLDHQNAEKRKLLYLKKRDIVMKLCRLVPDRVEQAESFTRNEPAFELKQYVLLDISRNFFQEDIPSDILKCIKYTKITNLENQAYLPHLVDMARKDM